MKPLTDNELLAFNSVCPDFQFKIGDTKARMLELARRVGGLDDEQLAKLEARLAGYTSTPPMRPWRKRMNCTHF